MKYVIVLGDGMADEPIESLGNKTPLEYAKTPVMDELAKKSEIGLVHTIPEGMKPGSDTANLSVLGYNPRKYYSGRSPLEALSIGVDMKDTDISLRCNFVTITDDEKPYEEKRIIDHSAGEISTEEATILLEAVRKELETETYKFYVGTSYRHLVIWDHGETIDLVQPHDVLDQTIGQHLPNDIVLRDMMRKSHEILNNHPINVSRREKGLRPGNSLWFWGAGTRPTLASFEEKTHKKGAMISAVDLLKGIAVGADMFNIEVEGANAGLHTNYEGKAEAAIDALLHQGVDFVYVHVEAPDEMGHQGLIDKKIQAIENLDQRVIKIIKEALDESKVDYRMLVMPDHPTPIRIRTHTSDSVPYMLYDSTKRIDNQLKYNEKDAKASGNFIEKGHEMIDYLFQ